MDPLLETVSLDIDESNDLTFKVKMEGTTSSSAKVRLVCEGKDFSYMFNGYGTGEDEVVQFTIPSMVNKVPEGTYDARVEVMVENRYFTPLRFQIAFKKTLSVVAESIQVRPRTTRQEIKVTAAPVAPRRVEPTVSPPPTPPVETPTRRPTQGRPKSLKESYAQRTSTHGSDDIDPTIIERVVKEFVRSRKP